MSNASLRSVLEKLRAATTSTDFEDLKDQAKLTTPALSQALAKLEAAGYRLAAWQYDSLETGWLLPETLYETCGEALSFLLLHTPETASTNSDALALGDSLCDYTCLLAEHQRSGRGRQARKWFAPAACDLLCSVIVTPPPSIEQGLFVLGVAALVAERLRDTFGLQVKVKWPNDLYLGGLKLAGFLAESLPHGRLVLGCGLNVNSTVEERTVEHSISLAEALGNRQPRALAACCFLGGVHEALESTHEDLLMQARNLDMLRHRTLVVKGPGFEIRGKGRGFSPRGYLLVKEHLGRVVELASGEVLLPQRGG